MGIWGDPAVRLLTGAKMIHMLALTKLDSVHETQVTCSKSGHNKADLWQGDLQGRPTARATLL